MGFKLKTSCASLLHISHLVQCIADFALSIPNELKSALQLKAI